MEQKLSKRNKIILAIVTVSLLAVFSALTYAYFSAGGVTNNATESNVVALTSNYGNVIINYKDGNIINNADVVLLEGSGDSEELLKFTITNTGTVSHDLIIYWQDLVNGFCQYQSDGVCTNSNEDTDVRNELNYTLYSCDTATNYNNAELGNLTGCNAISTPNTPVPATGSQDNMHTAEYITIPAKVEETNTVQYYVFVLTIENTDVPQNYNQNKTMSGKILVEFYGVDVMGSLKNGNNEVMSFTKMTIFSTPKTTVTDENGYYYFKNVIPGEHTLEIRDNENELLGTSSVTIEKGEEDQITSNRLLVNGAEINANIYLEDNTPIFSSERHIVSINVTGGTSDKSQLLIANDETKTATITANTGYDLTNATVTCDDGISSNISSGTLTISNVSASGTCNVNVPILTYPIAEAIETKYTPVSDAIASTYVTSATGINFSAISSDTNGRGLYINDKVNIASDPTQGKMKYFRGEVENYVEFGTYNADSYHPTTGVGTKEQYTTLAACQTAYPDGNCALYHNAGDPIIWRVIRIDETNQVRLITQDTVISPRAFNSTYSGAQYVGYTYERNGASLGTAAPIKTAIDIWYSDNLSTYADDINQSATYCNDSSGSTGSFGANVRLNARGTPTYNCPTPISTYGGTYQLPVAMITADEVAYAGGLYSSGNPNSTYYLNNSTQFWTMLPYYGYNGYSAVEFSVSSVGYLDSDLVEDTTAGARPVITLNANTLVTGQGTSTSPWVVQ